MRVQLESSYESFVNACRWLIREKVPPDEVCFVREEELVPQPSDFFLDAASTIRPPDCEVRFRVPRDFGVLSEALYYHSAPDALRLIYRLLWRILHGEPDLLKISTDGDVHSALRMQKQVEREAHRLHAFVRFRKIAGDPDQYVAWYNPDYPLLRREAGFFVERFRPMHWSILTPEESVHWNTQELTFGPGVPVDPVHQDAYEELWRTYYSNVFNPSRVNLKLTRSHLPVRHWKTLPESRVIEGLVSEANGRTTGMLQKVTTSALQFLPEVRTLESLRESAEVCRGCPIYRNATHLVFGTGPANAECMMVGEQPGDNEDRTGKPFVGPAGQLFDRALEDAGLQRDNIYLTGAVKHFKHEVIHGRRVHRNPNSSEINACRPWIVEELKIVKPRVLVLLGASAAQSVLGEKITLRDRRGSFFKTPFAPKTLISCHPASILRTADPEQKEKAYAQFVNELRLAATELKIFA